jgi:hypothetical protein
MEVFFWLFVAPLPLLIDFIENLPKLKFILCLRLILSLEPNPTQMGLTNPGIYHIQSYV